MSKRTTGGSRWSVWRWGRTPGGRANRATVTRTARATAARAVFAILFAASCGRLSQEHEYDRIFRQYLRGELASSADAAAKAAARDGDRNSAAFWKFRLLQAEALTALSRSDEAKALLSEKVPEGKGLEPIAARRLIDLAALQLGNAKSANELLTQARALTRDPDLQVRIHLNQGLVGMRKQDYASADREFQAGLDLAVEQGRPEYEALSLNNLCYCRKAQNRYEEAVQACVRAVELGESSGALRTAALAHGNAGSVYAILGDFPSSFEHQRKAIDQFRTMGAQSNLSTALGELGLSYDLYDEPEKAIPHYQEAYDLSTKLKSKENASRHAENMALALIKLQKWNQAAEWNRIAGELGGGAASAYMTRNRARIAFGRRDAAEASRICRELIAMKDVPSHIQWDAWELLGRIDAEAGRRRQADEEFERAVKIIEGTRSDLLNAQYRVTLLSRWITFYQSYVEALVQQNDDLGALRVVESSRARVLAERLGGAVPPGRFGGEAALRQFAREAKVSLVSFWIGPKQSFAWVVDAAGVRRFDLPPWAEVER